VICGVYLLRQEIQDIPAAAGYRYDSPLFDVATPSLTFCTQNFGREDVQAPAADCHAE
jgi:hypothetical protein